MAALYNNPAFKPDSSVTEPKCAECEPGHLLFHHTRTPDTLKDKYKELKKNLTVVTANYEKSGQNDTDKTEADFCSEDAPCATILQEGTFRCPISRSWGSCKCQSLTNA